MKESGKGRTSIKRKRKSYWSFHISPICLAMEQEAGSVCPHQPGLLRLEAYSF